MSVLVVDASVAAKWFVEEEYNEAALSILNEGHQLHAPDFLLLELDSVFCKRIRRGEFTEEDGETARLKLRQVPLQRHTFLALLDSAYEIANLAQRSIYDSLYVALALLLDAPVVTADRKLFEGLQTGPFKNHILWVEDLQQE